MKNKLTVSQQASGAETGAYCGDALSMPVHWYYDPKELYDEFGIIKTFKEPKKNHPGSIMWRSSYEPLEPEYDILGSQRQYWGLKNIHYHQFLKAGENTLNLKLLKLTLDMVSDLGRYDRNEYIKRYMDFMLHPDSHRDTYVEECHRGFFENLKKGISPDKCGIREKHIGGMAPVIPLYAKLRSLGHDHSESARAVQDHVSVTHSGEVITSAVNTLLSIAEELLLGVGLRESLMLHLEKQDLDYLQGKIIKLLEKPDDTVLGTVYSIACYLGDSLPASFYLALKYSDSAEKALVQNTMAGGENCHRGAVIGALLGLAGGEEVFPAEWRDSLLINQLQAQGAE